MRFAALALLLAAAGPQDPDPRRFKLAPGLEITLYAAEPQLQNPVAIAFDEQGRLFVAESHRRHTSLLDIHMRKEWLDDDLACRRHEDLVAYHRRRMGQKAGDWTVESERIRLLEDRDGDGRVDHAVTFSDGYKELGEGLGAGVLARGGDVWYTCIPNLWHLKDTDGDGKADVRKSLHFGFGVHLGANGHDMHGLRFGPDGKLYFSHGDRGFRVEAGGKVHDFPDGGGVFRCNPDGSELELVCTGLRNPQELAFDKYGNLFTGDNNISIAPDVGETCRWTYVVEGADYGWRIGYQFMPQGGAWCAEEQWRLEAGFQVPFVARLGHGPSGVTYNPGTGLSPKYDDRFFMCDYPGGIYTFAMKPKGAGFEMVGLEKFLWEITAPDVEFGNDGAMYVADWVGKWDKTDKGRVWRIVDPEGAKDPVVAEVKKLISEGMGKRGNGELAALLRHRDQRVRQAAQFELAGKGAHLTLARMTSTKEPQLARIHAIWGLGQNLRPREIEPLLDDADPEIRAQAAKTLGTLRWKSERYQALMNDPHPRVRYFAALAFGKTGRREDVGEAVELLRKNNGADRFLQHAGIMALTWIGDVDTLTALAKDPAPAVRMAALVALRKLGRPEAAHFLKDKDPSLVLEAARAIYDAPIEGALPALAELLERPGTPERALLRAVNAASRLGKAEAVAAFAADGVSPAGARVEALRILGEWERPSGRDRLMGIWRPIAPRARPAGVAAKIPALLRDRAPEVVMEAARLAGALRVPGVEGTLRESLRDRGMTGPARAAALRALAELQDASLAESVAYGLEEKEAAVLREAVRLLPQARLPDAAARLEKLAASEGPPAVRQAAIVGLGAMGADEALGRLADAGLPPALHLEWLEATSKKPALRDRLAKPVELLEGGDAEAGKRIFLERSDVQCVRCHQAGGAGGEVGPPLAQIGAQKTREYLLDSILTPNKEIAQGWGQTAIQLENGEVEMGRLEKETERELVLVLSDGTRKTIAQGSVKARKPALSAMPEDLAKPLSKRDLRDLVEFLSTLR